MEIELDLTRHCVETEIRRRYERALSGVFRKGADVERLEAVVELTRRALETFDFSGLRSRYSPLAGGSDERVALSASAEGAPALSIDGQEVETA